jgi:hypothetical protein
MKRHVSPMGDKKQVQLDQSQSREAEKAPWLKNDNKISAGVVEVSEV